MASLMDLHAAVLAALGAPGGFNPADVYDGEVLNPRTVSDTDKRIQPYAVLWMAPGTHPEQPLCGPDGSGEHRLHVTVAGYDQARALWAIDRARRVLDGAWLQVAGHEVGVRWLDGYTPPPVQRDTDVTPARWYCPLIFTALV